jgi:hypothetical protein
VVTGVGEDAAAGTHAAPLKPDVKGAPDGLDLCVGGGVKVGRAGRLGAEILEGADAKRNPLVMEVPGAGGIGRSTGTVSPDPSHRIK